MFCKCLPYMMTIDEYNVIEESSIWVQDLDDYVIERVNLYDMPIDINIGGIFCLEKKYPDIVLSDDTIVHNGVSYSLSFVRSFSCIMANLIYTALTSQVMLEIPVNATFTTHRVLYAEKILDYIVVRNLVRVDKDGAYYFFSMVFDKKKLLGVYTSSPRVLVDRRFCLPMDLEAKLRFTDKSVMNKEALRCSYR